MPASRSSTWAGMKRASHRPRSTPTRLELIRAREAPKNTITGRPDSAESSSAASWVLSPSSARKTVLKVARNTERKVVWSALASGVGPGSLLAAPPLAPGPPSGLPSPAGLLAAGWESMAMERGSGGRGVGKAQASEGDGGWRRARSKRLSTLPRPPCSLRICWRQQAIAKLWASDSSTSKMLARLDTRQNLGRLS